MTCDSLSDKVLAGDRVTPSEALALYRELPLTALGSLADAVRWRKHPERIVTYIVDRNINYTNVCDVFCSFCAFSRKEGAPDAYVLTPEQVGAKVQELVDIGGVQILLQGGHHPSLPLDYYLGLLGYLREKFPQVNIHGFSPPEFCHFTKVFKMPVEEVLRQFKEAGLGSIPGGGAEILVESIRGKLSPSKCTAKDWLRVMKIAHGLGLRSSATMMFGHVETVEDRIEHLRRLRELQDRTGGFTAFIGWTFQPENTRLGGAEAGAHEYLRTLAVARIFLDNFANVQSSWVTQGPQIGQIALTFGANDLGSVMMEENVVSSAGATFRMDEATMQRLIRELGCEPRRRNNWYELLNQEKETMADKYKAILMMGAPGSGKGTHGKWLGNLLGFVHVASGDLFRALDKNSELGKIFVEYSSKGLLVPDDFTVRLWADHMRRMVAAKKFNPATETLVLDGIPRNVNQAKMMDPHIDVQKIIVIAVEHGLDEIVQRMKLRAEKEGRHDDANEATIRNRFAVYQKETKPVLDHYPANLRVEVNGLQGGPVPVAHDVICALLGRTKEMKPLPC